MHNPNVSEEAKERAAHRLEEMGASVDRADQSGTSTQESASEGPHESNRVLGGYKATLSSKLNHSIHQQSLICH